MVRTELALASDVTRHSALGAVLSVASLVACGSSSTSASSDATDSTDPSCTGDCSTAASSGGAAGGAAGGGSSGSGAASGSGGGTSADGIKNGAETDVDCGGGGNPPCAEGKACNVDTDCTVACSYAKTCVGAPSCAAHFGGDTCGIGEVGDPAAQHESCCRTLPVPGYTDAAHAGKTVYVDKYEITAGRVRQWITSLAAASGGKPDVKAWIAAHRPAIWDDAWNDYLPTDTSGGTKVIARRLLGDPRPEDTGEGVGPGVILPPATDQSRNMGTDYQFGDEIYVDLHGNNCATHVGDYGFPTYWYPASNLSATGQVARADARDAQGQPIPAQQWLDVKSMNCITNEMLAAFCAWDGGQLVTDDVVDFITASPASLANTSGCGTQYDNHGELLGNNFSHTVQTGGSCPAVTLINATFDAGDALPIAGSILNIHNYHFPDLGSSTSDKAWEISAPGRASTAAGAGGKQADTIRINAADEPWMDLAGNLSEAAFDMNGTTFSGLFAMKYRGIGYGSARSDLNNKLVTGETVLRLQRPEAKAAYTGGRCMRFK